MLISPLFQFPPHLQQQPLFNIFLSFSSSHEVQASPRSSDGGEKDRKYEKSERSEHSEPQQPEPEVEAVVAAVNEMEIEKIWGTYMKFVTTYQMSAINSCWEKCDKKWAYTKCMFKVKKNERSEHSEPQQPEPEVEAVVAAVNEVEIEKKEELASEHLPRNCKEEVGI
jgi:hypothetical protein